jgi:hypothetical protein
MLVAIQITFQSTINQPFKQRLTIIIWTSSNKQRCQNLLLSCMQYALCYLQTLYESPHFITATVKASTFHSQITSFEFTTLKYNLISSINKYFRFTHYRDFILTNGNCINILLLLLHRAFRWLNYFHTPTYALVYILSNH